MKYKIPYSGLPNNIKNKMVKHLLKYPLYKLNGNLNSNNNDNLKLIYMTSTFFGTSTLFRISTKKKNIFKAQAC